VDALKAFITDKSLKLFEKYEVLSHKELPFRYDIYVETYAKQINIEALVAIDMGLKAVYPPQRNRIRPRFLAGSIANFKTVSVSAPVQEDLLKKLAGLLPSAYKNLGKLEAATAKAQETADTVKKAERSRDKVVTAMQILRADIDALEMIVPEICGRFRRMRICCFKL